ncbi:response regulator [Larkinella soli]|uniref:response regulator n=1 Tax=Larkinella soli TaxID=1770527 RepID=UPI000FFBD94C|nr:response regulator [Larkinella soli]
MQKKKTILIADDDAIIRRLLTYQLTLAGYDVLAARDGSEAFNWLRDHRRRPDLLLLDLFMPRQSGLEVIESLKSLPFKIPVILMSGADRPLARQGLARVQVDAFLAKPFSVEDLLHSIEEMLQVIH